MAESDSTPEVRPCAKCGTSDRYKDGRCKQCSRDSCKKYHTEHREKANADSAARYALDKEKHKAYSKAWAAANREKSREIKAKWAKENPEKIRAKNARYYQENREALLEKAREWERKNRDKSNASDRAWRRANPERHKAAYTARRKKNPEQYKAVQAAYRKRNPESVRFRDYARRAIGKRSTGNAKGLIARLIKLQRGLCPCCKQPLGDDFHLDHITPLSRGGAAGEENIQLMRAICNQQKSAKDPIDFMQSRGFLL